MNFVNFLMKFVNETTKTDKKDVSAKAGL